MKTVVTRVSKTSFVARTGLSQACACSNEARALSGAARELREKSDRPCFRSLQPTGGCETSRQAQSTSRRRFDYRSNIAAVVRARPRNAYGIATPAIPRHPPTFPGECSCSNPKKTRSVYPPNPRRPQTLMLDPVRIAQGTQSPAHACKKIEPDRLTTSLCTAARRARTSRRSSAARACSSRRARGLRARPCRRHRGPRPLAADST